MIETIKNQYNNGLQDFWYSWIVKCIPNVDLRYFLQCNLSSTDINKVCKFNQSSFWYEVFSIWGDWNYDPYPVHKEQILKQPLWYNSLLKIQNKHLFYRNWYNHEIGYVSDLIQHDNWITCNEIYVKYKIKVNFLDLIIRGIISGMPKNWKYIVFTNTRII